MNNNEYTYSDFATDGKRLWYITMNNNLLMEINITDGNVECLGSIPTNINNAAYRTLEFYQEKIYLVPYFANQLCVYDLAKKEFLFVKLLEKSESQNHSLLMGHAIYNNKLIMWGNGLSVVFFDLKTKIGRCLKINNDLLDIDEKDKAVFWKDGFVQSNILFIPIAHYSVLAVVDLETDEIKIIKYGNHKKYNLYQIFRHVDENLYFIVFDNEWKCHIMECRANSLESSEISVNLGLENIYSNSTENIPFMWGEVINKKLILAPARAESFYIVDLDCWDAKRLDGLPVSKTKDRLKENETFRNYSAGLSISEHEVALVHTATKKIVKIKDNGKVELLNMKINMFDKAREQVMGRGIVLESDSVVGINNFLLFVNEG